MNRQPLLGEREVPLGLITLMVFLHERSLDNFCVFILASQELKFVSVITSRRLLIPEVYAAISRRVSFFQCEKTGFENLS